MGGSAAGIKARTVIELDFALIGHQESWKAAADVLAVLRGPNLPPLPYDEIKDILPWIPPRAVCHVEVGSTTGANARGLYIDSFIPPDRLEAAYVHDNLARVRAAAACAIKAGARIVSLGGFSSILIEGNFDQLPQRRETVFTTGNSLTVSFIVQGIKKMCALERRSLRESTLLIVGASGDVGSGCARCLAPFVRRLQLYARNPGRLRKLASELDADGREVEIATDLLQLSAEADLVICAASLASPSLLLDRVATDAIICDAGYPKNLSPDSDQPGVKIFFGGLGQITGGLTFTPDFHAVLNQHPFPDVAHGCLLEGMALALERRFEPFSQGRGSITPARVEAIEKIAARHGIFLAPLYNAQGSVEKGGSARAEDPEAICQEPRARPWHVRGSSVGKIQTAKTLERLLSLFDVETLAHETLSEMAWEYITSGAADELTVRSNHAAFEQIQLMPNVFVDAGGSVTMHPARAQEGAGPSASCGSPSSCLVESNTSTGPGISSSSNRGAA